VILLIHSSKASNNSKEEEWVLKPADCQYNTNLQKFSQIFGRERGSTGICRLIAAKRIRISWSVCCQHFIIVSYRFIIYIFIYICEAYMKHELYLYEHSTRKLYGRNYIYIVGPLRSSNYLLSTCLSNLLIIN
jgi:hypothetical protein